MGTSLKTPTPLVDSAAGDSSDEASPEANGNELRDYDFEEPVNELQFDEFVVEQEMNQVDAGQLANAIAAAFLGCSDQSSVVYSAPGNIARERRQPPIRVLIGDPESGMDTDFEASGPPSLEEFRCPHCDRFRSRSLLEVLGTPNTISAYAWLASKCLNQREKKIFTFE